MLRLGIEVAVVASRGNILRFGAEVAVVSWRKLLRFGTDEAAVVSKGNILRSPGASEELGSSGSGGSCADILAS